MFVLLLLDRTETYTFILNFYIEYSEMNLKVRETGENYSKMLYKEALKTGFYELQTAKDKYLQLSEMEYCNHNLIVKYIKLQTIMLSPICPHICEHIWLKIMNSEEVNFSVKINLYIVLYKNIIEECYLLD